MPGDASPLTHKLIVGESSIAGLGLFAVDTIEIGEVCCRLSGTLMDDTEFARYIVGRRHYSALAVDESLNLVQSDDDPTTTGNHSCDPNMWMSDAVTVVARRRINIGEEATIDYALLTGDDRWSMECNCGSELCRRVIRGSDWRRHELQDRYHGHWSPFIVRRIEQAATP